MKIKGNVQHTSNANILEKVMSMTELLEKSVEDLRTEALDAARKKDAFARKKAIALIKFQNAAKSQDSRDALADSEFAEERLAYLCAEALKEASVERVRSQRQILSSLQTIVNAERSVADMLNFGQSSQT